MEFKTVSPNCRWFVTNWSPCSKPCGLGRRTRKVVCHQQVSSSDFVTLLDSDCSAGDKPVIDPDSENCGAWSCPAQWVVVTDWSPVRQQQQQQQ